MVQLIPHNKRGGALEGFLGGLQPHVSDAFAAYTNRLQRESQDARERQQLASENAALAKQGIDLAGVTNPQMRALLSKERSKQAAQQSFLEQYGLAPPRQGAQQPIPRDERGNVIAPGGNAEAIQLLQGDPQRQPMQQAGMAAGEAEEEIPFYERFTPQQRAALSILNPQLSANIEKQKSTAAKKSASEKQLQQSISKEDRTARTEAYKINQPFIEKVYTDSDAADQRLAQLTRMEQLNDSGELSNNALVNVMETIGLPIELLNNYSNEEYTKLAMDLTSGITSDYGSRILATEFNTFLKRIPTLRQTPEGRKQIITNLKTLSQIPEIKKRVAQEIIDEHEANGTPLPFNMRGAVDKRAKPQIEQIYDSFKNRYGRVAVPKGTALTQDAIDKYLALAFNADTGEYDLEKAQEMAKEDGYKIGE